jgi:hypothetical protein
MSIEKQKRPCFRAPSGRNVSYMPPHDACCQSLTFIVRPDGACKFTFFDFLLTFHFDEVKKLIPPSV